MGVCLQKLPPLRKTVCSSHQIHEETLNNQVEAHATTLQEAIHADLDRVNKLLQQTSLQAPCLQKKIAELKAKTEHVEQEISEILNEKLKRHCASAGAF